MQVSNKTDYELWKEWLDKWSIPYEVWDEYTGVKELRIEDCWAVAYVQFELDGKFIRFATYE